MSEPAIPSTAEEVTPSWITAALGSRFPGTEVAAVEHGRVIHGSLTKIGLTVRYGANPAELPESLFLKAAFEDHGIPVSVRSEAIFYANARPEIAVTAPVCVYASHDADHGIVIMEDLAVAGAAMSDPTHPWPVDAVADGLDQLASLHAAWWGRGLAPGIPDLEGSNALGAVLIEAGYWESCVDGPTGVHVPEGYRDRETMAPRIRRLWDLDTSPPRAFLHGDAHLGNTYRLPDGRPGFLDWGGVTAGHWAREVCYFLAGALSPEDRRSHERELLDRYLGGLDVGGVGDPPRWGEAWDDYRRHFVHGLLWFLCPTQMQPEAIINANVERFAVAATDHEVDDLF